MTLLDNLFSKKPATKPVPDKDATRGHADTFPPSDLPSASHSAERRSLRLERRELLYAVVRESMARVGMLSSSYKYKVLSLDPRGRQYLIMMDLPQEISIAPNRLAEIESVVAQNAKARHDIVVTAVYWRLKESVIDPGARKHKPARQTEVHSSPSSDESGLSQHTTPEARPIARPSGRFEPIREDEVAAFKQALASGNPAAATSQREKQIKSWKHTPIKRPDFADTEMQDPSADDTRAGARRPGDFQDTEVAEKKEKPSPLSSTQYGDLI